MYYAPSPVESPKPPAPMPAPGQSLPLASNPSAAFPDTQLFGTPPPPFVLKPNEIKPSTDLAPDSLRYQNISGLNPVTSITSAKGPTSSDSSPLFSGEGIDVRMRAQTRAATAQLKAQTAQAVAQLQLTNPLAAAALSNGLINIPPGTGGTTGTTGGRTPQQAMAAMASLTNVEVPPAPTADHLAVAPVEAPSDTPATTTVPVPSVLPVPNTGTFKKKGFVAGNQDPSASAKIASLNVKWYYTWGSTPPTNPPQNLLFSPMFWNISKAAKAPAGCAPTATPPATVNALCALQTIKALPTATTENVILAYNEPDGTNAAAQGNMKTSDAAAFWPNIVAAATRPGCRIGSPVMYGSLIHPPSGAAAQNVVPIPGVTSPQTVNISNNPAVVNHVVLDPTIWLDNFLLRISGRYPDFLTIHWYGPPVATSFLNYLQAAYTKYNLPIWVTEYSCADWGAQTNAAGVTTNSSTPAGIDWSIPTDATINTNSTAVFMRATMTGMEAMPFVERYSWKERFFLSDPNPSYPPNSVFPVTGTPDSVMGPSNPNVMNQSTLFASYQHFPTSLPPLTPLGKLYASL